MPTNTITLTSAGVNSGPNYAVYWSSDCVNYTLLTGSSPIFLPSVGSTASVDLPLTTTCISLRNINSVCNNELTTSVQLCPNPTTTTTTGAPTTTTSTTTTAPTTTTTTLSEDCVCYEVIVTSDGGGESFSAGIQYLPCDGGSNVNRNFLNPGTYYQCARVIGGLAQIEFTFGTGTITPVGSCNTGTCPPGTTTTTTGAPTTTTTTSTTTTTQAPTTTTTTTLAPTTTTTTSACVTSVSFEVDSAGDVRYVDCCGNTIYLTFGIGPQVINDCLQIGSLFGVGATISFVSYGATACNCSSTTTTTTTAAPTTTTTTTQAPTTTTTTGGTTTTTTTTNCPATIYTHGAVRFTCSDFCNTNYLIQTTDCASQSYGALTIGDFIYGYSGQSGYIAYSNVSTDTNTGPFRIADIDGSGEILGIYVCSGGSCVPL